MKNDFSLYKIFQLTAPTLLSQATLMLVGVVDVYFAGTISTSAIATLGIAHTTWSMIVAFFEGLRLGTTVINSRFYGAQRHEDMYHVGRIGLAASAVIGILLVVFGKPISRLVYSTVVKDAHVQALGLEYLPWILACGGFVFVTFVVDGMFRGVNRVVIPTIITLITQSLNIGLNCVFVWGLKPLNIHIQVPKILSFLGESLDVTIPWHVEPMGIKGIALATFIAYAVAALFAIVALYTQGFKDLFRRLSTPFAKVLKEYTEVAADVGLHSGFRLLAMFLFTRMLGHLGASSIASFHIASQVFHMSYIPGLAFMITMSMLIGKLMGGAQTDMLWHVAKRVSATALTCAALLGVGVFFWAYQIATFFTDDLTVAASAATLIRIVAGNQFVVMLNFMFRGYLNGVKETAFLMRASIFTTYGVFLPLAYLFAVIMNGGLLGAYCGVVIWNAVDTLVNFLRSRFIARKLGQERAIVHEILET
jgi:MATE family multidrug resistance protein